MQPTEGTTELGPPREKHILRETVSSFMRHGGTLLSGAVAFFALLSAAPLLMIVLEVAGRATDEAAARNELVHGLARWLGADGARTVESLLANVRTQGSGALVRVLGGLALVYGSTRLFSNLQRALNHMWDVTARSSKDLKSRAWRQLRKRALAFFMVIVCGLFLLVSVLVRAAFAAATELVALNLPSGLHLFDPLLSFVVVTLLFTAIFKLLPDVRVAWRDAFVGALFTSLLFSPGRLVIGLYLGHKSIASVFGVAGSIIMVMLWAHYSAQIFFLGAAFTAVRARRKGRPIQPNADAVSVHVLDGGDSQRASEAPRRIRR